MFYHLTVPATRYKIRKSEENGGEIFAFWFLLLIFVKRAMGGTCKESGMCKSIRRSLVLPCGTGVLSFLRVTFRMHVYNVTSDVNLRWQLTTEKPDFGQKLS